MIYLFLKKALKAIYLRGKGLDLIGSKLFSRIEIIWTKSKH